MMTNAGKKSGSKKGDWGLLAGILLMGVLLATLGFSVARDQGQMAAILSMIYGILVTVFLLAQVYGFVISQVSYVDRVEKTKWKVLEVEGLVEKSKNKIPIGCFFCGVDSGPVLTFFIWLVGAGVGATVCFLVWGLLRGKFSSKNISESRPLDVEGMGSGFTKGVQ